jgi:hypothetical protein
MSLDLVVEVWDVLKHSIDTHDRNDAADAIVNLLVDNNYDVSDIQDAFRGDKNIKHALKFYAASQDPEEEEPEDDESWD